MIRLVILTQVFVAGVLTGVAGSIIGLQPIVDTVQTIIEQFRG